MSTLNALMVAVDAAARQRDAAFRALQDAERAQQAAQEQLRQLETYADETQARWGMRADAIVQPEVMFHHYQFMGRLGHAAGLQTGVVGDQAERAESARRSLLEADLRLVSLRKVVEKRQRDQALLRSRHEQKQTDERAALRHRNPINGHHEQEY